MELETLLYEKEDRVAILTLNRPEVRNAFNYKMADELGQAWQTIKTDPEVTCVIVTGAGEKALCTGVDVVSVQQEGGFDRDDVPDEEPPLPQHDGDSESMLEARHYGRQRYGVRRGSALHRR